jgi:hypothetical protein
MVTTDHHYKGPRPFAASNTGTAVAVAAMWTVLLTATVTTLLTVLGDHPDRWRIVCWSLAGLAAWSLLLAAPALGAGRQAATVATDCAGSRPPIQAACASSQEPTAPGVVASSRKERDLWNGRR